MKRYYISPLIAATSPVTGATGYRPKVALYGVNYAVVMPAQPDGVGAWALVVVTAADHTALLADSELDALPDLTFDAALSNLTTAQRNALLTRLQARGIDTTALTLQTAFRAVLRRIGRFLQATFDENALDVSE